MHEADRSGRWLLLPIVNFVLLLFEGTEDQNRFGRDSEAYKIAEVFA